MHAKELAVAPPFRRLLDAEIVAVPNLDTDELGTFSGEVPRPDALVETALLKAEMVFDALPDVDCALASEGSYGPIERQIEKIARNVAAGFGAEVIKWRYERRYPATVNSEQETEFAAKAAGALVGLENVNRNPTPAMGSEDFAWMLLKRPGCYIWIGNGDGMGSCMVHNPGYDFNDEILPIGASYWATLVEQQLAREALPQAAE